MTEQKTRINPKSAKGRHMVDRGEKTRGAILSWYKENPNGPICDCAKELKVSWATVKRHLSEINKNV